MTDEEAAARAFCKEMGIDPDEMRDSVIKRMSPSFPGIQYVPGPKEPAWKQYVVIAQAEKDNYLQPK